jgi:hypothetical protein
MSDKPWPPYRVGNPQYIHALGVIASVFNLLEFRFRSLFGIYTKMPLETAYITFTKITNETRLELVTSALKFSTHPDPIKDDVSFFLKGYKICAHNRNTFMHSTVFYVFGPDDDPCPVTSPPHAQPLGLGFQKSPKGAPYQINTYQMTLAEIRKQADALKSFEVYGDHLYWHILKNYEPTRYQSFGFPEDAQFALPNRPALPEALIPSQEIKEAG